MRTEPIRSIVAALVLALVPATLAGQEQADAPSGEPPQDVRELIAEIQQVQAELQPIQQRALADPELQAQQAEISARVQAVMAEVNPEVPQHLERMQALVAEADEAEQNEDEARMRAIIGEAQAIEAQLQQAQTQAIARLDIAADIREFESNVRARMIEVDPAAAGLFARLVDLDERLSEVARSME